MPNEVYKSPGYFNVGTAGDVTLGTPVVGQVLTVTAYGSGVTTFGLATPAVSPTPQAGSAAAAYNPSSNVTV